MFFKKRHKTTLYLVSFLACNPLLLFTLQAAEDVEIMTSKALASFPTPKADYKIFYGDDPLQFGELSLPKGDGPFPIVMFIHGGCWLSQFDITSTRNLARNLANEGIAVWNVEYRKVGDKGGEWPATFKDISAAGDFISTFVDHYNIDMNNFTVSGHSAGGHLALWYANRPAEFKRNKSLTPNAVVALAPAADLRHLSGTKACGSVVDKLMGGTPMEVPQRYELGDGVDRAPINVPQTVIIGKYDTSWSPVAKRYAAAAKAKGATVSIVHAPNSGHFEMIDPRTNTWRLVLNAYKKHIN